MNLKEQIESYDGKYEGFSEELLKQYLEDIFFGKDKKKEFKNIILPNAKEGEIYTWKDKIKEGYLYQAGVSPFIIITGSGGAIRYGNNLQELGYSNEQIEEDIQITNTEGIRTHTVFVPIKFITWHKIEKDNL